MSSRSLLLLLVIAAFGVLTARALAEAGYFGVFMQPLKTWAGTQVLVDLVILGALSCVWMLRDARTSGVSAWPFVALTLAAGSFGPLLYLVLRERAARARASA